MSIPYKDIPPAAFHAWARHVKRLPDRERKEETFIKMRDEFLENYVKGSRFNQWTGQFYNVNEPDSVINMHRHPKHYNETRSAVTEPLNSDIMLSLELDPQYAGLNQIVNIIHDKVMKHNVSKVEVVKFLMNNDEFETIDEVVEQLIE